MPKGIPNKKPEASVKEAKVNAAPVATAPAVSAITDTIPPAKVDGLAAAPAASATARTAATPTESTKEKILVVLNDQGGIDFGSMREKTKDKFVSALRRSEGDLFPKAAEAAGVTLPDEAISAIYNMIGIGETMLASMRVPQAIAAEAFMFTRPQIDALKGPTKAVIAKHAKRIRGFEEETALGLVLVQVHFEKMATLRTLMAEYAREQQLKAAVSVGPGPKPDAATAAGMPGSVSPGDGIGKPEVQ